jgi:hypothetical protein
MTVPEGSSFCCEDFVKASEGLLTHDEEDENSWSKHTPLDGWYIRGRPYDSWGGYFGKGKKFNYCPWCGKSLKND